eukprot:TRINITY_DN9369_c0_g1_i2.p1 TRINITY_DN9369_c0_g1~~TRINITY_DN9369_c0_g1_i2.p1  ORF type:complete len:265 (+),score=35.64 TRINITY_DN9369_c0_g1_i2:283-1077(+)
MLLSWNTAFRPLLRAGGRLRVHRSFRTSETETARLEPAITAVKERSQSHQEYLAAIHAEEPPHVEFKAPSKVPIPERFVFVRRVGRGGFGRVLLVREKETDELLTLKRVRPNDTYALEIKERIALQHPFVVKLVEGFDEGADRVLMFEFCSGPTFSQVIDAPVVLQNAPLYFAQLVLALEYLHSQGIVHRDIKPENLLLDGDGVLKLGDLGLAKRVGKSDSRLCGTMAYMPPEMVLTQMSEPASDWWSAGCLSLIHISEPTRPY